ncbi:Transglutaminase-like enzyme, putative cysteine protease [Nitrosomonas sp. Nm51]|uniref:transglutaminase-like domain-containing protein n=1 Tax=Nitrosomonas sp. Nm51 TaxID=133720 RepID=UPI0008B96DF0|nr:transglutaminase-like domain-containing protein [Nitrosomonas sp. Nm51]SER15260.1 Transglutaminase-like enzyme, putative cysteine protease [Nitrosomonas sp. Nm51]
MKRRDFIKIVGASGLFMPMTAFPLSAGKRMLDYEKWNSFRLTYEINLPAGGKNARLWLPLPNSLEPGYQYTQGSNWSGNATQAQFSTFGKENFPVFMAQWRGESESERRASVQCIIKTSHHAVDLERYQASDNAAVPGAIRPYLLPTRLIPVDGIVRDVAYSIIYDEDNTALDKARSIYDWLIDHFQHDETAPGSGTGDIKFMLENSRLSGKCIDVHSLFVGLARAAGIPARIQYGIRMMESEVHEGLGRQTDISRAQHSRAEFYLNNLGWVPVNPADVCKVAKLDNLEPDASETEHLRENFFGSWEMNWITFNHGQDIELTNSKSGKLPFFLFPHAEIDNQALDSLSPEKFSYRIASAELIGTGASF